MCCHDLKGRAHRLKGIKQIITAIRVLPTLDHITSIPVLLKEILTEVNINNSVLCKFTGKAKICVNMCSLTWKNDLFFGNTRSLLFLSEAVCDISADSVNNQPLLIHMKGEYHPPNEARGFSAQNNRAKST